MAAVIPTIEPKSFLAGDTLKWRRENLADYPASAWTLTYYFRGKAGQFDITAAPDGELYTVEVAAADTAKYKPGNYRWRAFVVDIATGLERYTIGTGLAEVVQNFETITAGTDIRSHNRIMVDALRAMFEKKATKDQTSYKLANGRELARLSPAEVLEWLSFYESKVAAEEEAEDLANGIGQSGKMVLTRMRSD